MLLMSQHFQQEGLAEKASNFENFSVGFRFFARAPREFLSIVDSLDAEPNRESIYGNVCSLLGRISPGSRRTSLAADQHFLAGLCEVGPDPDGAHDVHCVPSAITWYDVAAHVVVAGASIRPRPRTG
jgi:hypothetical protein